MVAAESALSRFIRFRSRRNKYAAAESCR